MTTVRTDLRNTRESAQRIRFEPSGDMTQTNVQKEIEELDGRIPASAPNSRTVTTSGDVTLLVTDVVVYFNKNAGAVNLPSSVSWAAQWVKSDFDLVLIDVSGAASSNNLTATPNGTEKIDGLSSVTINTDYGVLTLKPLPAGGWAMK
jgi:hypothetical protein